MAETLAKIFMSFYGIAIVGAIVIAIFLIIRRIKIKKTETFEKRDN